MRADCINVFLLAENCLLRESLSRILHKKEDFAVAGAVAYSPTALSEILAADPDVVLLDSTKIALSGPRVISRMREAGLRAKVVMIGMEDDEATFVRAVAEGVVGYVLQDATSGENVRAIRAVASGEAVCPSRYSARLFECAARDIAFSYHPSFEVRFGLTRREQQLTGLIRLGLSNKEIGDRLNLSEQTVKNHIHRMLRKVGARDRMEIVALCQSENPTLAGPQPGEPTQLTRPEGERVKARAYRTTA